MTGRPTKYKKKFAKRVDEYIKSKADTRDGIHLKVQIPSFEDFAVWLGVSRKSLQRWEKNHEEFAIALDKIRSEQRQRLIENGLSGKYNAAIVKLMLMNNHGMRERADVTTDETAINTFNDEQINRIAERIARREKSAGDKPSTT